jgi:hypothetical protein
MSNTTSVVSSAEGPSIQEEADKITAATHNPNHAETREVVIKYNKESDKNSGDGTRAMRRQGGTVGLVHGVKRDAANITTVRENPKAAGGWLSRGLLKVLGVRCPSAKNCAEQRKKIPYIRSDTEKMEKPRSLAKKKRGPTMGLEPEPTWV